MRILFVFCLVLGGFLSPVQAARPSFDCGKASNRVEQVICQSDALAQQDLELARLYRQVSKGVSNASRNDLKQEQLTWLKERNRDCALPGQDAESCLAGKYRQRNRELAALLAFDSTRDQSAGDELKVLRVTPKGNDVPAGRQIVFQFDRPVVPIGKMARDSKEIPVTITPALACEWRWLNTSALACQLTEAEQMHPATRYEVIMQPGLRTLDGATLNRTVRHSFTTARPKVNYTRFVNWLSPGTPLIQVSFNLPVTRSSVETALSMTAGKGQPVRLLAYPDDLPREWPWWQAVSGDQPQQRVADQLQKLPGDEARKVWIVEPRQELPAASTIRLVARPGLVSPQGPESGIENRTVVSFETYPAFKFLGIRCTLKGQQQSTDLAPDQLETGPKPAAELPQCAPLSPVALIFSAPVLNSAVRDHVQFSPRLDGGRSDYDPWENTSDWTHLSSPYRSGRVYQVWLPELLQADQRYEVAIDRANFRDEFGRRLDAQPTFAFATAHREPDLRLTHEVAVLEKGVASDVPLYVTNLQQVKVSYDKLTPTGARRAQQQALAVPAAEDISYALPLGVHGLLNEQSGVLFARVHPEPTPPSWYRDPQILAQVTPFQAHVKLGHFNSLVWVTSFADGKPVTGAKVSLYRGSYEDLPGLSPLPITAQTDANGLATLPGVSVLDPDMKFIDGGYRAEQPGFFARVDVDGDLALVPLNSSFSVWGGGVYPDMQQKGGHSHAWGTTAQGIYKLGDTIQYKIYVRDQSNEHWVAPAAGEYELQVFDPQHKVVHERKQIVLNRFGAFAGEFKVAEQGSVGWYQFQLTPAKQSGEQYPRFTWSPLSVLVSDFTPAPFKVKTELNGDLFSAADQVRVSALASLHSGGAFTAAEVRLTARLNEKTFTTTNPKAKGFVFGSSGEPLPGAQRNLLDVRGRLDDHGQYEDAFTLPDSAIYYGSIMVEAAVKDDRGKFVAASTSADYAGRSRFVGLRNTAWLYQQGKPATIEALVVDQQGKLQPGVAMDIQINHRQYQAARVKGPGNAYLTKNIMSWVKESSCTLQSQSSAVPCDFVPAQPGYYQFVATIRDDRQREQQTTLYAWVTGQGHLVWDQSDDATLQIVAEQEKYRVGETARYLLKNPFPGAQALVTVERYGVLDSWIETLETSTPVLEIPIKEDYLPGFYLSVVVVSPRIAQPLGPGKVDLGKPSYRMGYVKTRVADPAKELAIKVTTDKAVYKPGELVKARIQVGTGEKGGEPYEIAVAVVDEAVLALNRSGENYYDPYAGFNRLDALDVYNYSLISRLVGRQKFEKKGANPGGDGVSTTRLRSIFKFVSYWNPSLTPGPEGYADIEFTVPDNLTGWRIFAFAVTPNDRMGLGDVNFKVNRPTEIRPVLPNQVLAGDHFQAGFSINNRTGQARTLQVKVKVAGPLPAGAQREFSFQLKTGPYERNTIWLPVATQGSGTLRFVAEAGDRTDTDGLTHSLPVNRRSVLETAASYGTTTAAETAVAVQVPSGILADVGSVGAILSPSVLGNIDGAFRYLRDYPYACWEQQLSKAVVAHSYLQLKAYLGPETRWPKAAEDIAGALAAAANFQAPNGGMAYWVPLNNQVSPYLSAYTALAFNWLKRAGYQVPAQVEERLHNYLVILLRRDQLPTFYTKGMASTVRAVALAALAENGKITAADIQRYLPHVPEMDLFGQAHFLQAAIRTAAVPEATMTTTLDSILGHASQSGGKFQFNEAWDDSYKYLLATPLRSNCAILSSLLSARSVAGLEAASGDIPFKLVRTITQSRGKRDHWENTQENLFCLNALSDYARQYETSEPQLQIAVDFAGQQIGTAQLTSLVDPPVAVTRPLSAADAGRQAKIELSKQGEGRFYYAARLAYALADEQAQRVNSGIEIRREYAVERAGKFVLLQNPMTIRRGELVRVDLFVSVPTARHFVVVDDPVPGGLEPVNTDLATASQVDADKGRYQAAEGSWYFNIADWSSYGRYFWSFYHQELRHAAARFYADYLPAGNYHLAYTAQAIAAGVFSAPAVSAAEMYDPDVYGKGLPATLQVNE